MRFGDPRVEETSWDARILGKHSRFASPARPSWRLIDVDPHRGPDPARRVIRRPRRPWLRSTNSPPAQNVLFGDLAFKLRFVGLLGLVIVDVDALAGDLPV